MSFELWLAFVTTSVVLLLIPGPTILTVVSYAATHGRRATLPLILAVALGDSAALALSLLGLGALLSASAFWFTVVKVLGGCYLIWLGIGLLRSGVRVSAIADVTSDVPSDESYWRLFANTWIVTALNPKGIVFFVAFLPQFIDPTGPAAPQQWVLALTFVVLASLNAAVYAIFAGSMQHLLAAPRARQGFRFAGGSMLTLAGLWSISVRQSS